MQAQGNKQNVVVIPASVTVITVKGVLNGPLKKSKSGQILQFFVVAKSRLRVSNIENKGNR